MFLLSNTFLLSTYSQYFYLVITKHKSKVRIGGLSRDHLTQIPFLKQAGYYKKGQSEESGSEPDKPGIVSHLLLSAGNLWQIIYAVCLSFLSVK